MSADPGFGEQREENGLATDLAIGSVPVGDPYFYEITREELEMYERKNRDYAGGGVDPNGNFNRVSAFFAMYPGLRLSDPRVVGLAYMMKQLDQVLFSLSRGYEGAVEGLDSRLADIHIYAKIVRVINRRMTEVRIVDAMDSEGPVVEEAHPVDGPDGPRTFQMRTTGEG